MVLEVLARELSKNKQKGIQIEREVKLSLLTCAMALYV